MAINQNEIVDLLYKKLAYSVAKTNTGLERSPTEENIASPVSSFGNYIWVSASSIPATPPSSSSVIVQRYQRVDDPTSHVLLTRNSEVSNNRSWIAKDGNSDPLRNWVPPVFGSGYSIKVWAGNPLTGGSRLYSKGSGSDDEFYFDYDSGTLNFIGNSVPVDAFTEIYIEGYRYTGSTDIGSFAADSLGDLLDVNLSSSIDTGQTIVWDGTEWINSMPPGGSSSNFLIVGPQAGQALLYDNGDSKFKNQFLNIENLGNVADLSLHAGEFLKVNDTGDAVEYALFSSLFTAGNKIDLTGSQISHEAVASTVDFTGTLTAQDWIPTDQKHGTHYASSLQLKLLKDIEMDAEGHVLARVWTDITGELYNYVDKDEWQTRWDQHVNVSTMTHNIWDVGEIEGIDPQLRNGLKDKQLLIRNTMTGTFGTENVLQAIDHNNLLVIEDDIPDPANPPAHPSQKITELHATHLLEIDLDVGNTPVAGDVLSLQDVSGQGQLRWGYAALAGDEGEANSGVSLTSAVANTFDIFLDKPAGSTDLRFRGIKFVDGVGAAITTSNHTWDDGTDPTALFPLTVQLINEDNSLSGVDTTLEIGFDPSQIRVYNLADQMPPTGIGYPTEVLQNWVNNDPNGTRPGTGGGQNSVFDNQYQAGWFSYDSGSGSSVANTPNSMSQVEWAALQGGGGQNNTTSSSRRLRTSSKAGYSIAANNPLSLQQQIDDKLQYNFFVQHMTLGGRVSEYRNGNFGGYKNTLGQYGDPTSVMTTEGLTNPIYQGEGWAHESKGIIFDASDLYHFGQGSTWGDSFNAQQEQINYQADPGTYGVDNTWFNDGIQQWSIGGNPPSYHTVRSVIKRHINTHINNPHGVTHVHVESDQAHWNANSLMDAPLNISSPTLGQILKYNPSANNGNGEWYNAGGEAYAGESNIGENYVPIDGNGNKITTGVGYFYKEKDQAALALVFKGLKSNTTAITVTDTVEVVEIDILPNKIKFLDLDLTNNGTAVWPPDIDALTNVDTLGAITGQALVYDGSVWGAQDSLSGVNLATITDQGFLQAQVAAGGAITWEGIEHTSADKLASTVGGIRDIEVDYSTIADSEVLAYSSATSSWKAIGLGNVGQANEIASYLGTPADPANGIAGDPATSLAAEGIYNKDVATLYVKGFKDSPTIVVDTSSSDQKYISLALNSSEVELQDVGGALDPAQIDTGSFPSITANDLGELSGAAGGTGGIGDKLTDHATELIRLEDDKTDLVVYKVHAYDKLNGVRTAQSAYNAASSTYTTGSVTDGNLSTLPADVNLKHQPYEIGNIHPVFNANRLLNSPIDPTLSQAQDILDGNGAVIGATHTSNLTLLQEGKFLKWDGAQWTLGGGGEIVEGEHGQFGFFYASNPLVSTATNVIRPTGGAFNFYEGNSSIGEESKIGIHTASPPEVLSIAGFSPCVAVQQIISTNYEPEELVGWGKLYARTAIGGISVESKVVLHFDGPHNANSFINEGVGEVYFLPMHDAWPGNGTFEYNNVKTVSDKHVYGNSAGYFPGGFGDYIAGNNSTDITIAQKPFDLDFWMMPLGDYPLDGNGNPDTGQPRNDPSGKRYLVGQYEMSESRWHLSVDFDSVTHDFEFFYRDYDSYNATFTDYTITLQNPLDHQLQDGTWYHIVFQRYQVDHNGVQKDMWELHIADGAGGTGQGAPVVSATGQGIPHQMTWERTEPPLLIQSIDADLIIGHANRKGDEGGAGTNLGFKGYMDEFRYQIGSFINWSSVPVFRTFLLPYDTGKSSLIFKDSGGSYDLLNAAGVVRKLLDQDGDTRVEVDFNDINDNTIRFRASGNEVITITKDGLNFVGGGTVARLDDHLNTANDNTVVTQKAIVEALNALSPDSIKDLDGYTGVYTAKTAAAITFETNSTERLKISSSGVDIKAPLLLSGASPTGDGQVLMGDINGDLAWGAISIDNISAGTEGNLTYYTANGMDIGPTSGMSWDETGKNLTLKGKQKFHYQNMDEDDFLDDIAEVYIQHNGDGNDQYTRTLHHFDQWDNGSSASVDFQGNLGTCGSIGTWAGQDTQFSKFGGSSFASGEFDSSGNLVAANAPMSSHMGMGHMGPIGTSFTYDFWIRPALSNYGGSNPAQGIAQVEQSKIFGVSWEGQHTFMVYADQYSGGDANQGYIDLKCDTNYLGLFWIGAVNVQEWTHVALMRKDDGIYSFINGYPTNSRIDANQFPTNAYSSHSWWPSAYIGHDGSGNSPTPADFFGHIDEFRMSTIDRYDYTTGFVPRNTPYGTKDTQFIVKDKNNNKTNVMESDPGSVYTTDIIKGNYLVKGQGESSKEVVQSTVYETGGSLYIPSGSLITRNWNAYTNGWTSQNSFISTKTGVSNYTHALVYGDTYYNNGSYLVQDSLAITNDYKWVLRNHAPNIESKFKTMGATKCFHGYPSQSYFAPPGFGTLDGCIEFWIRSDNTNTGTGEFMRFSGDSTPYLSCSLSFSNGEGSFSFSGNNSGHGHSHEAYPSDQSQLKYTADEEWHHFAWVRNGTFSGFFINGELKASTTMASGYDIKDGYYFNRWWEDAAGRQKIGWNDPLSSETYLCDLEITIGHSKYGTANFTPPTERNQETLSYTASSGSITNISTVSRAFESGDIPTVSSINNGANMPTGSLVAWAGSSAPQGWLATDGSDINRTTYAALFSVIGTTYGAGDGSTTFGLPNFNSPAPWIIKI